MYQKEHNTNKHKKVSYILFDLEAVGQDIDDDFMEIIEIGAYKVEVLSPLSLSAIFGDKRKEVNIRDAQCVITDSFHSYVKPIHHKTMSKKLSKLVHISKNQWEEICKTSPDFETVMKEFISWAGENAVFVSWSSSDEDMIIKNYEKNYIFDIPGMHFLDLQFEYDKIEKKEKRTGLKSAMEERHIAFVGLQHTASADAYNMLHVFQNIMLSDTQFSNRIEKTKTLDVAGESILA